VVALVAEEDHEDGRHARKRLVLSVVILALNAAQCLPATLHSVAAADELNIADGESTGDIESIQNRGVLIGLG